MWRWLMVCLVPVWIVSAAGEASPGRSEGGRLEKALSGAALQRVFEKTYTDPGSLPELRVAGEQAASPQFPLQHTAVSANIEGDVAAVTVTQRYRNLAEQPIEVVYVFPLPENAAVDAMKFQIGERVVEAEIKERQVARRTYDHAKQHGHAAALLEQERPNVFTQSVANIPPRTELLVTVSYLQPLTFFDSGFEFVFPMVVGPRFSPSGVADAGNIQPPLFGNGERNGHDVSLSLRARAHSPITTYQVPTHDVVYEPTFDGTLSLTLSPGDRLPNRDFVLRYAVDASTSKAALLSYAEGKDGYLSLLITPPKGEASTQPRELVFVVDISGSMHGVPLSMCQDAMRAALTLMRPTDTFNVITFAGYTAKLFTASQPANQANLEVAGRFVSSLQAGGGTMLGDAIKAALDTSPTTNRTRHVFFMTDGYVGNEASILADTRRYVAAHRDRGSSARVFGFGVGSSVNRFLIEGLGKEGDGLSVYATTREDPADAVNRFFHTIDRSVLEALSIDWGGLPVTDVLPTRLPDLFADKPIVVRARYDADALARANSHSQTVVRVRGTAGGVTQELPTPVRLQANAGARSVRTLWARERAHEFEREMWAGDNATAARGLTELGLNYGIVTRMTSLVAVDRSIRVDGQATTVQQPGFAPEGVDREMAGGQAPITQAQGSIGLRGIGSGGGGAGHGYGAGSLGRAMAARPKMGGGNVGASQWATPNINPPRPESEAKADEKPADDGLRKGTAGASDLVEAVMSRALLAERPALVALLNKHGLSNVTLTFFVSAEGRLLQIRATTELDKQLLFELRQLLAKVVVRGLPSGKPFRYTLLAESPRSSR